MAVQLPELLVGAALLLFGRRLYYVFVGGIGAAAGLVLAARLFPSADRTTELLVSAGCAVAGILLVVFVQRLAVGFAGFLAGAWLARIGWEAFGTDPKLAWVAVLAGGVVGALLSGTLFGWALVLVSSSAGAALVTEAVPLSGDARTVVFVVLLLFGVAFQAGLARSRRRREPASDGRDGARSG